MRPRCSMVQRSNASVASPKARSIQWERLFRARSSECGRQSAAAGAASDHRPHRGCRAGMGSPVPPESKSETVSDAMESDQAIADAAAEHHTNRSRAVSSGHHTDRCGQPERTVGRMRRHVGTPPNCSTQAASVAPLMSVDAIPSATTMRSCAGSNAASPLVDARALLTGRSQELP